MRHRVPIVIGVALAAAFGLSSCAAPSTPPVPTATPPVVTLQEPSTDVLSATEVNSRGYERVSDSENAFLAIANLGDVDPVAPDEEGSVSFPEYAKQGGAAVPTAEYALNLTYWACDYAATTPPEDGDISTLIDALYAEMLAVTGYTDGTPAAQVYGDLMFRGTQYICEPEFAQYVPEDAR